MGTLSQRQTIDLRAASSWRSASVQIDMLTAEVTVRLRRPTTAAPLDWPADARLEVILVVVVDGVHFQCRGSCTGGIRLDRKGNELQDYRLTYRPPVVMRDGRAKRIGETATEQLDAWVEITALRGRPEVDILDADAKAEAAPIVEDHHSVAFDASSSAQEINGDGVLSLTHTCAGSDRAAFAGVGHWDDASASAVSYAGTGMTQLWLESSGTLTNSGFQLVAPTTGAQTVTSTITASQDYTQVLQVQTFTGVDQTTPVGTDNYAEGTGSAATVTVAGVVTDGMVVDHLLTDHAAGTHTVGANQTQRESEVDATWDMNLRGSTQASTDGGVMSWTVGGSSSYGIGWTLGAVEFKPVAGAPAGQPTMRRWDNVPGMNVTQRAHMGFR